MWLKRSYSHCCSVTSTVGHSCSVSEVISGFIIIKFPLCLTLQPWGTSLTSSRSVSVPCSINSCPNNCSGHGRCSTANSVSGRVYCECEEYWKGEACDIPYCRDNCGSPDHGYCDLTGEKLCVCNDSWQGKTREEERGRAGQRGPTNSLLQSPSDSHHRFPNVISDIQFIHNNYSNGLGS